MHLTAQFLYKGSYWAAHVRNRSVYEGSHEVLIIAATRLPARHPGVDPGILKLELLLQFVHLSIMLSRPDNTEYAEFYKNYIARVPDGPVTDFLSRQAMQYRQLLSGISDHDAGAPTAPGKWSIKQVLGHVCDAERVMAYRALRFARGDQKELHGFEQDDYVREAASNARTLADLLDELDSVRQATIALLKSLPPGADTRAGVANGNRVTVRALAYIVAGHAQHHYDLLKAGSGRGAAQG